MAILPNDEHRFVKQVERYLSNFKQAHRNSLSNLLVGTWTYLAVASILHETLTMNILQVDEAVPDDKTLTVAKSLRQLSANLL